MIRSIVVPLDGSRFAETALPRARQLAVSARAELHLTLIHQPTTTGRREAERYLADLVARIAPNREPVTDFSIRDGDPVESLVSGIRQAAAELVVMATHGRGSIAPLALTSIAEGLIRTSPAPLLLVQPRGDHLEPSVRAHSLLAPVDLDRDLESVIAALADFACLTQAHVTLLHVVTPVTLPRGTAQKRLDRLADELRARGIRAAARVVGGTDIAATIIAELAHGPADLLAVAPRRAEVSGWSPADGITESLLRNATKPVLILSSSIHKARCMPSHEEMASVSYSSPER